jgi:hypothetical protein
MPYWIVRTASRDDVSPRWPGCQFVATFSKEVGSNHDLIEADEAAVAAVRTAPGVEAVEVARGDFVADDGTVYAVSDDGQQLRIRGRG